ncbi:MAG: hypothetical protein K9J13_00195 [Saprospiraceae bacterium]|nr:hypothetical protein [Saprospiraceae bacterium]
MNKNPVRGDILTVHYFVQAIQGNIYIKEIIYRSYGALKYVLIALFYKY